MNEEEVNRFMSLLQQENDYEKIKNMQIQNDYGKMSSFQQTTGQNLAEYQLDPDKILDRIYHIISSHILIKDKKGGDKWEEPKDDRVKIFSDYGVQQIMQVLYLYINPNTLLSNFDKEQIANKVYDFAIELSDLIHNRYEYFFYYPSPEELFEKYLPITVESKLELTQEELYNKCLQWSEEELQQKIRHYPMLVLAIVDAVHATYLRALNGEERESLRKFMHISQNTNLMPQGQMPQNTGFKMFKPSTWT